MLGAENWVQVNSGSFTGTSGSASLPSGTTAGNTVFIAACAYTQNITTPTGFVLDKAGTGNSIPRLFRRSNVPAAETSWTLAVGISHAVAWVCWEQEGLDPSFPVDVVPAAQTSSTGTLTVGTSTPVSTAYDAQVVAIHAAGYASTSIPTWSGHDNGFEEFAEQGQAEGAASVGLSVSRKFTQQLGAYTCTAAATGTPSSLWASGFVVVYAAAGSKRAADVRMFTGFGFGTTAGLTTGVVGFTPFDAVGGTPAVIDDPTRSGYKCLELSSSAAAEYVQWTNAISSGASTVGVIRVVFRTDTTLPSTDTDLFSLGVNGGTMTVVRYRTASQKLGVQIGAGTEQLSANAVSTSSRYAVDLRVDQRATTWAADWQIDGTDQTQATTSGLTAGSGVNNTTVGWTTSATATIRYEYVVLSSSAGHYPLGDFDIRWLGPDPAGTVTVSGSTANFGVMSASGTIGAWNATTARDAVDDWPPTLGASADGFVAVTASATDYVEVPMDTVDVSGTGSIRAVRPYLPMWAASATAATCQVAGWDGTTAFTFFSEQDPNADNTSTPAWVTAPAGTFQWKPTGGWTQAKLDAAAIRFGSNDATPDIGPHAVGIEVAIQAGATSEVASVQMVAGRDDMTATVDATLDPVSGGALAYTATVPTGVGDATVDYTISGTPTSTNVPEGTTDTEIVDAPDSTTVSQVGIRPTTGTPDV